MRIILARPIRPITPSEVAGRVGTELANVGVHDVTVGIDIVDAIPRTRLGKAPLTRRASHDQLPAVPAATRNQEIDPR